VDNRRYFGLSEDRSIFLIFACEQLFFRFMHLTLLIGNWHFIDCPRAKVSNGLYINKDTPFTMNSYRNYLKAFAFSLAGLLLAISPKGRSSTPLDAQPSFHTEVPHTSQDFVESIGVNTHINYFDTSYGNSAILIRELKSLGIRHLRDGSALQNDDYNNAVYSIWRSLGKLGIRFNMVFDPRGSIRVVRPDLIERLLSLSGNSVESIEGPNELDLSKLPNWPELARTYQQELSSAARRLPNNPTLPLIGPSMAFVAAGKQVGSISPLVTYGNLHSYPAGHLPSDMLPDQIAGASAMYPGKQIVITETGYHNAINDRNQQPPVSEAAAAKYIPRLLFETFNHGIVRTYLYEFEDEFPDPGAKEQEKHWGLLRNDGTEKPSFIALRNIIATLTDDANPPRTRTPHPLAYALQGDTALIHHTLLEKADGRYYLALWQEVPSFDVSQRADISVSAKMVTIALPRPLTRARLYDSLQGTATAVKPTTNSSITVAVPDHVILVEILPS
jgi:hypothetical protein